MQYLADRIFGRDKELACQFYEELSDRIEGTLFPCDKMCLNPFYGFDNEFVIVFLHEGEEVSRCVFKVSRDGMFEIKGAYYKDKAVKEMYHKSVIEKHFNALNRQSVERQMKVCGLTDGNDNSIVVDYYQDGKKRFDGTRTLTGSLEQIFDDYTTMNDTLRYCNGCYHSFADEKVSKLYRMFTSMDKDYFLMNAVRRGVTID